MATRGRPTLYSKKLGDYICGELASGRSLVKVCEDEGMPGRPTIYTWLRMYADFRDNYTRAKDDSADALADDIQELAESTLSGKYDANAARVAIEAKKWVASKMKPKKYGDKLDVTSDGKPLPTPIYGGAAKVRE